MAERSSLLGDIVVVGHGLVAASAAVTLATMLRPFATRVRWVQTPSDEPASSVEVADPALVRWLAMVGVSEADLVRQCGGVYSLGAQYESGSTDFFVPHGTHGISPSPAPFEQEFFKRFSGGDQLAFTEHFLATRAAQKGRFAFPVDDPRSPRSTLKYGLHLAGAPLLEALTRQAARLGVESIATQSIQVQGDPDRGVQSVCLDDGTVVRGDFFIDATGPSSQLLGQTLAVECASERRALWPWRITFQDATQTPLQPHATLTRMPWGWCRRAPLRQSTVVDGWVHDQAAAQQLERELGEPGKGFVCWPACEGAREAGWRHNCLALGHADARPGELVLSQWYWATRCLLLWLELLPGSEDQPHLRREYNRRRALLFDRLNEVHWMHTGQGACTGDDSPEALRWRLELFTGAGRLWRRDDEVLGDEAWLALALGLGWHAGACDMALADVETARLARKHHTIYQSLAREADTMPSLEAVLEDPAKGQPTRSKQQ